MPPLTPESIQAHTNLLSKANTAKPPRQCGFFAPENRSYRVFLRARQFSGGTRSLNRIPARGIKAPALFAPRVSPAAPHAVAALSFGAPK
jgi:hypothetical protein